MTEQCKCCGTPVGRPRSTHLYRGVCIKCRDTRSKQVVVKATMRPDKVVQP